MTGYQSRYVDKVLDSVFDQLPAVLLDGPKGVGKTMTASQRVKTILSLDIPALRATAMSDPDELLKADRPILVDEWHLAEPIWGAVKRAVDGDYSGGQFLLTGSLPSRGTHSGAGRITSIRMRPMTLVERGVSNPSVTIESLLQGGARISGRSEFSLLDYVEEILASGFPGIRRLSGEARELALAGYLSRIVDTDVQEAGLELRRPELMRNWLSAYAAAIGTNASWTTIRDAAARGGDSPARSTTVPYTETLARIRILDEVEPWSPRGTGLQRLMASAKHYLADPALGASLLGLRKESALESDAIGGLFENLVALSLRVFGEPSRTQLYHLRTQDGRKEIDFILERPDGKVLAIEAKFGSVVNPGDIKHLDWLGQQIGDQLVDKVIINTGRTAYRTSSGVAVIPLALLG